MNKDDEKKNQILLKVFGPMWWWKFQKNKSQESWLVRSLIITVHESQGNSAKKSSQSPGHNIQVTERFSEQSIG